MNEQQDRPSGLTRLSYDAFVWLYRLHLGFLFAGHVFVIAHHGRKSGKRYLSGLEDERVATQALQAGVQDYLPKGAIASELLTRSISLAVER